MSLIEKPIRMIMKPLEAWVKPLEAWVKPLEAWVKPLEAWVKQTKPDHLTYFCTCVILPTRLKRTHSNLYGGDNVAKRN
jgi:hypothetical protein